MEGYGAKRIEPTSIEVKERQAKDMAELMSTRQLLLHQDYTEEGSGAYNEFQRAAIAEQLAARGAVPDDLE
jgi:hypothetical protein